MAILLCLALFALFSATISSASDVSLCFDIGHSESLGMWFKFGEFLLWLMTSFRVDWFGWSQHRCYDVQFNCSLEPAQRVNTLWDSTYSLEHHSTLTVIIFRMIGRSFLSYLFGFIHRQQKEAVVSLKSSIWLLFFTRLWGGFYQLVF